MLRSNMASMGMKVAAAQTQHSLRRGAFREHRLPDPSMMGSSVITVSIMMVPSTVGVISLRSNDRRAVMAI